MSEKIKLVIAIPTAGKVHVACAYSLAGLVARFSQGIPTRPEAEIEVAVDVQVSSVLTSNRELLVRRAIDNGNTHIMFLDDDMGFSPEVATIMLGRRQPVVACNYLIKHQAEEDPAFVAVGLDGRRIVTKKDSIGLQECSYTGFGVSLFETRVFAAVPQPWFEMKFVPEASCYTTEDNPCYEKIRKAGFPVYIDHDASKLIDHNGDSTWKWNHWRPAKEVKNGNN